MTTPGTELLTSPKIYEFDIPDRSQRTLSRTKRRAEY